TPPAPPLRACCKFPSPLVGEGGRRSLTDEGWRRRVGKPAASVPPRRLKVALTPLIRAPPAPTFSHKGRRACGVCTSGFENLFDFKAPPSASPVQSASLSHRLMIPFAPDQSLRFQTIQTNWTLFFRPASL